MKRGQVANEFVGLVGLTILLVTIFVAIQAHDMVFISKQKESNSITDFGLSVQKEIMVASEVNSGFVRSFFLPEMVNGHNYTINNTVEEIYIVSQPNGMYHSYGIPPVSGYIQKGWNKINKSGGVVYLN